MPWYSACLSLLFSFRTNGKKGHLDENDFRQCYGNFSQKWYFESYLITAMFKVPSQQLRGTLTTTFWKILYSSIFYCQDFNKRHWNENRWRCLEKDQLRINPSVYLKEHCTKVESTFHLFYALLFLSNLVFKFNIVLIGFFW